MAYQVLARKYRPRTFSEVIGQEHVLKALINALDQGRLHHAYLFTGTRGVGKTSLARILAKCLNCEKGVSSTPCLQCNSCQEISQGRFADLLEVDAASRTKVEDTRELLENVQYAPTRGRYKVYLIDEVHMLSGHSFNALLKTLEEPPPHVKFLLATTDPQRLPVTVLSRCLQFNLKNVPAEHIKTQLEQVLTQEQIPYEAAAVTHLARAANGSIRDALSLLDQAIAYSGDKLTEAHTQTLLGSIEQTDIIQLLHAVTQQNGNLLLTVINQLAEKATDFSRALEELLSFLHRIAVIQVVPDADSSDNEHIAVLAQQIAPEDIQLYYQIALIGRRDLALAPNPRAGFEMILLRMLAFSLTPVKDDAITTTPTVSRTMAPQVPSQGKKELTTDDWAAIYPKLNLTGLTQTLASHCLLKERIANKFHLLLDPNQAALRNPRQEVRLAEALSIYLGENVTIQISLGDSTIATPARLKEQQQTQRLQAATHKITADANVQSIMKAFDATIQPGSIQTTET